MDRSRELIAMQRICSKREYCSSAILEKLERRGLSKDESVEILKVLQSDGFVDDVRFARAFARDKSALSGWGDRKILSSLRAKGISCEIAANALKEIDRHRAESKLCEVLSSKWRMLEREEDLYQRRMKLLRFGVGRGYSFDEINDFLERYGNN